MRTVLTCFDLKASNWLPFKGIVAKTNGNQLFKLSGQQDKIDIPKWAEYVKTGHMKELGPYHAAHLHRYRLLWPADARSRPCSRKCNCGAIGFYA